MALRQKMVSFDLVPLSSMPSQVEVRNLFSRERGRIRVKSEGISERYLKEASSP